MPIKSKFLQRIFRCKRTQSAHQISEFTKLWNRHKNNTTDNKELVNVVVQEVSTKIHSGHLDPEEIIQDGLNFTKESTDPNQELRNREILLELIDLCATHGVVNRQLVREVISTVFSISKCIDRAVFLFKQADSIKPVEFDEELLTKQNFILSQTAGWKVDGQAVWGSQINQFFLDQPFRRASSSANSTLMAEAMYRQQDPEFVLRLLRHGMSPSCLYLWPICILIDLKFAMTRVTPPSDEEILSSKEALMVRFFCRARNSMHLHVVRTEDRAESIANLPMQISYDDILLIPPRATILVPESRYKHPSSLMQQSRLAVRQALLEADQLPRGITGLPIPHIMQRYVDLEMD